LRKKYMYMYIYTYNKSDCNHYYKSGKIISVYIFIYVHIYIYIFLSQYKYVFSSHTFLPALPVLLVVEGGYYHYWQRFVTAKIPINNDYLCRLVIVLKNTVWLEDISIMITKRF
jgi:hypothetical protein